MLLPICQDCGLHPDHLTLFKHEVLFKKRRAGERSYTKKAKPGASERSGREQTKERLMEKLRGMGYW